MSETIYQSDTGGDPSVVDITGLERLVDARDRNWEPVSTVEASWLRSKDYHGGLEKAQAHEEGALPGIIFDGSTPAFIGLTRVMRRLNGKKAKPEIIFLAVPGPDNGDLQLVRSRIRPGVDRAGFGSE